MYRQVRTDPFAHLTTMAVVFIGFIRWVQQTDEKSGWFKGTMEIRIAIIRKLMIFFNVMVLLNLSNGRGDENSTMRRSFCVVEEVRSLPLIM